MQLYDNISDEDRAEVEKRLKALEKPRKVNPLSTQGFDKVQNYGLTFSPHVVDLGRLDRSQYPWRFQSTYAQRQEAIYKYVMEGKSV